MNYALGYCMSLKEILEKFPIDKLEMTCKQAEEATGDMHRDVAIGRIFMDSVDLVINDIIENNVTFEFPRYSKNFGTMHVRKIDEEEFKIRRRKGEIFDSVDFLKSNFSGNQLVLNMTTATHTRHKNVYINKELQEKLNAYTNEGKQYC